MDLIEYHLNRLNSSNTRTSDKLSKDEVRVTELGTGTTKIEKNKSSLIAIGKELKKSFY